MSPGWKLGARNLDRDTRFNGGPGLGGRDLPSPGANCDSRLARGRKRLTEAQKNIGKFCMKVVYDPTLFVTHSP